MSIDLQDYVPALKQWASITSTGKIWYWAGWAVTQATNKWTGVTLSTLSWTITTNNAELAAAAEVTCVSFSESVDA